MCVSATTCCPCVRWCLSLPNLLHASTVVTSVNPRKWLRRHQLLGNTDQLQCHTVVLPWKGGLVALRKHTWMSPLYGHCVCVRLHLPPHPCLLSVTPPAPATFYCGNPSGPSMHDLSALLLLFPSPCLTWKPCCSGSVALQWRLKLTQKDHTTAKLVLRKQDIQ